MAGAGEARAAAPRMNRELDGQSGDYQNEIYTDGLSGVLPALPMEFQELEARAQAALSPSLLSYAAGGAGDESTHRANVSAFLRWGLVPRMTVGAARRDMSVNLFGTRLIILPCAAGVLGRIAHGQTESLIERAADVMLKQRRRLVLCLREAPLNLIHLRNMVAVTEAGATVYPMIPTYYNVPETLAQLRDEFVERVLQFLGLPGTDRYQWDGSDTAARREHTQAR
ncbi:flavoprotein [Streptomyces mirabilis]